MSDTDWRDRCTELTADRDYWRSQAETWQRRYVDSVDEMRRLAAKIVETPAEPSEPIPTALTVALDRASAGLPADIARTQRREVIAVYAKTAGEEDQRVTAALQRLHDGDGARVAAFLGEES